MDLLGVLNLGGSGNGWFVRISGSLGSLEVTSLMLLANGSPERQTDSDDGSSNTHGRPESLDPLTLVGNESVLRNARHDLCGGGRDGVSDLVGNTWESGAELRWRKLVEVNGDDTPSTLNHELQEEGTNGQTRLGFWQDPAGDQRSGTDASNDDGASTTDRLGDVYHGGPADGSSDLGIGSTAKLAAGTIAEDENGGTRTGGMGYRQLN